MVATRRVFSHWIFKLLFSVVVAVVSLIVVIAVVEGRHWFRIRHGGILEGAAIRFDPLLGWAPIAGHFTAGHGEVRINSSGFRSSEIVPDTPTIVLLGDSVAFGLGHSNKDTPSGWLEALVKPRGIQVQNFSAPGYGPGQNYLRLRQNIDRLPGPRWVVLVVCSDNDLWNMTCNRGEGKRKPLFVVDGDDIDLTGVPVRANDLRNHLDSSPLGPWAWNIFHMGPSGSEWLPNWIGDRCIGDDEAKVVAAQVLRRMDEFVESRGDRFSTVIVPHGFEMYHYPEWTRVWEAIIAEAGVEYFDFRTFLLDRWMTEDQIYRDGLHLTELGCRLLAEYLIEQAPAMPEEWTAHD